MRTMIGQVAGETALRWFAYVLVAAFGLGGGRPGSDRPGCRRRRRVSRYEGIVPRSHARSHEEELPNV